MWLGGVAEGVLFGVLSVVFDSDFGLEVLWREVAWCVSGGV